MWTAVGERRPFLGDRTIDERGVGASQLVVETDVGELLHVLGLACREVTLRSDGVGGEPTASAAKRILLVVLLDLTGPRRDPRSAWLW